MACLRVDALPSSPHSAHLLAFRFFMPVINRIAEFADEVAEWRRDFHVHPELQYELPRTSGKVAELLRSFGVDEVVIGIAQSGVVGVIRGRGPGRTIGLRADMDALPIVERTGKP